MLEAVRIADKYGIELKEPTCTEKRIEELGDELEEDHYVDGMRRCKIWDWDDEVHTPPPQS
jgi:hypothetical protein